MQAAWQETANRGPVLYLEHQGRRLPHINGEERAEALSLWEGIAGYAPAGRIAFWRWKRGLGRLQRLIKKAVKTAERECLSA